MNSSSPRKKCKTCEEVKELSEFYVHPKMRDGRANVCKRCDNKRRAKTKKPTVYTPERRAANNVHVRHSVTL